MREGREKDGSEQRTRTRRKVRVWKIQALGQCGSSKMGDSRGYLR